MNPIDLINTVNQFYDQAFNRLLVTTFGILAFIGVFVPLAVGWLQLRTLRAEKSSLLNELRSDVQSEREVIESKINEQVELRVQELKSEFDSRFERMTKDLQKSFSSAKARAHHLQGNGTLQDGHTDLGMSDFSHAASLYFVAEEEANARRCIGIVLSECLPKINSKKYQEHDVQATGQELIETLKANNQNSRYEDDIKSLEREMAKASSRAQS